MSPTDNDFIPIRVSTLRGDQPTLFDVYLKVAGKQILYYRSGDKLDNDRLIRLKEKKIKQLYIRSSSEGDYRTYLTHNLEMAYKKPSHRTIEERAQIVQGLQQASTEEVMENLHTKAHYEAFKEDTRQYIDFILQEDQALRCILNIRNDNANVAHHGVNVATLAVCLATQLGHTDSAELQLLATGCLLHDIEHNYNELNVARPLSEFSPEEIATYRKHPDAAVARVQETKFYDQLVMKIMRFHHEHTNGTGFPDQLKEHQLPQLVMIASVADSYDRLISLENISPKEAIKKLLMDKVGLHPLPMIQGLNTLLKQKGIL